MEEIEKIEREIAEIRIKIQENEKLLGTRFEETAVGENLLYNEQISSKRAQVRAIREKILGDCTKENESRFASICSELEIIPAEISTRKIYFTEFSSKAVETLNSMYKESACFRKLFSDCEGMCINLVRVGVDGYPYFVSLIYKDDTLSLKLTGYAIEEQFDFSKNYSKYTDYYFEIRQIIGILEDKISAVKLLQDVFLEKRKDEVRGK